MDWLKKMLEGLGLTAEQIEKITEGVKGNYEGYVPKHRFDEVNDAKKQLESDIKERDKQLVDLKKNAGDNDELKKQLEQLQKDNKKKDEEYQAKVKDMSITSAIKLAVAGEAHDPELITGLVDKNKLLLGDDGKVTGLDEQIQALRDSKAFLFVPKEPEQKPQQPQFRGAKPAEGSPMYKHEPDFSAMSDEEYYRYKEQQNNK